MSIFFDFEVGPKGRRFRRAVDADKYCVQLFWNRNDTDHWFGDVDLGSLIELSVLSICQIDKAKNVTGILILDDRPNIPALDPADWEVWIRNMYELYYLARNTLFIHFVCCTESVKSTFFEEAIISVFKNDIYLKQILFIVNNACSENYFEQFPVSSRYNIKQHFPLIRNGGFNMYELQREVFIPKLKIRRAVEEDNDDVVQIMDKKSSRLREMYGDFYVSELIARPDGHRKIIVAEYHERAGAVMCINSKINYYMLQRCYNLSTMHGLRKPTLFEIEARHMDNVSHSMFSKSIIAGQCTPFCRLPKPKKEIERETTLSVRSSKFGKIVFRPHIASNLSVDAQCYDDISEDEISMRDAALSLEGNIKCLSMDPDELDFDIVNIDEKFISPRSCLQLNTKTNYRIKTKQVLSSSFHKRVSKRRSTTFVYEENCNAYEGPPNAFMIELYALDNVNLDEVDGITLLEGAFEIMSKFEYCIIRQPFREPTSLLLQNFCFVPPTPRAPNYTLYVAHRSSFLGQLRVCKAEIADIPQITEFLHTLNVKQTVWTMEHNLLRKSDRQVFLLMCSSAIVGVAIIDLKVYLMDFLQSKYNLSTYHLQRYHYKGIGYLTGVCSLVTALVNHVFEPHYRFFIRDILRQVDRNCMIWLTNFRNKWEVSKINCLVGAMVPLTPVKNDMDVGNIFKDAQKHKKLSKSSYMVWFMDRKMTSLPRYNIDTRILVIGASRTGISFLNTLLFSSSSTYLTFTDVTLLSTDGLPHLYQLKTPMTAMADMMFPCYRIMTDKHMRRVPYSYYANIIKGTMVEIDREKKYVLTNKGERLYYDLLFLLFGKQYQHPNYLKDVLEHEKKVRRGEVPYVRLDNPIKQDCYESEKSQWKVHHPPENVFIINSLSDAHVALKYVKHLMGVKTIYTIIVYGASIHAYCCLATLVAMKVPSSRIIFVEPFPPVNPKKTRITAFCNTYVDQTVNEEIQKLKIKVFRKFYFQSWSEEYNVASQVNFISYFQQITLPCDALFFYGKRGVDTLAYIALHKSGICYDGGILIDQHFRTHDHSVYSAGTVTRYGNSVAAHSPQQKYYNSAYLGEKLGFQIRNMLDPLQASSQQSEMLSVPFEVYEKGVIEFLQPIVLHCRLPGGLFFLNVRPPGLKTPHPFVQSLQYNGHVMETFEKGYFKLHFNNNLMVDGITCLTKEKYALENFVSLYGLPAVVLNNIHIRFATKKITDLFSFFTAPWAYWLYHSRRDELLAVVKELTPQGSPHKHTIRETLLALAQQLNIMSFNEDKKSTLRSNLNMTPYITEITNYVIEWLSDYHFVLPMYLQPWQVRSFDFDHYKNPLFRKKRRTVVKIIEDGVLYETI